MLEAGRYRRFTTMLGVTFTMLFLIILDVLHSARGGLYSPSDAVVVHTSQSFEADVLGGQQFWVIEFFANWCGGCRMVAPWYKQAAKELKAEGIQFGAVDMDGPGRELGPRYGVAGMPHIMAFAPGVDEPTGMQGLGGAASIVGFAKKQWEALTEAQRQQSITAMPPPPPAAQSRPLPPLSPARQAPLPQPAPAPIIKLSEALAKQDLQNFGNSLAGRGHTTTATLMGLGAAEFATLCTEVGMSSKQTRNLRKLLRSHHTEL